MTPLAVGFYCPGWPPAAVQSGIVTYVANLRPGLERAGATVHVLTSELAPGADPAGIYVAGAHPSRTVQALFRVGGRLFSSFNPTGLLLAFPLAHGANDLQQRRRLDVLEMEESFGAARYVQQMTSVPVVVRLHGPHFLHAPVLGQPVDPGIAAAERRCVFEATAITAPARDVLDRVRAAYGLPLSDAAVIPNPVPVIPPERRWTLEGCDKKTILFVGRFDRHKGGDLVIDAFRQVAATLPRAELLFVGPDRGLRVPDGPPQTIGGYLDAKVPATLRSRIHVLGPLPAERVEGLRRQAFVTVVASRYEIFGLALAESLAFGCPTVAANVGGIPEVLLADRTGLLFAGSDAADLAAKILVMFAHPAQAAAFGQRAAADMTGRLSPDVVARVSADYYRAVVAQRPRVNRRAPLLRALSALPHKALAKAAVAHRRAC